MKVQSTLSVAEQMMQSQVQSAATSMPETPFQDLLADAMQSTPPEQKQPEAAKESQSPAKDAVPEQEAPAVPPETEPDDGTMQNAAALAIAPQIIVLPECETQEVPVVDSVQTAPIQTAPIQTAPIQAIPAEAIPVETQPAVQEAAVEEGVVEEAPQPGAKPANPIPMAEARESGSGIEFAELIGQTETQPVAQQQAVAARFQPDPEAQARFDAMVQEAAHKLQGTETPEIPEPISDTAEAPNAIPHESVRTIPTELRRKSETPEETLTMAAEPKVLSTELPEPEIQAEAPPRQAEQPTPARQVETQVARQLEEGGTEFHMQLNPHELGRVNVKMVLEDGKLAVQIAASTEKALEALRKESDGLIASLRAQGIQVETVSVVPESQTASGHMHSPFGMAMGGQQGDGPAGQGQGSSSATGSTRNNDAPIEAAEDLRPDRLLDTAV